MKSQSFTFSLCTASAIALAAISGQAAAQTPRANGETVGIQNYASTTGNMHAIIAKEKGFCEKYNFKCEIKITQFDLARPAGAGRQDHRLHARRRGSRRRSGGRGR